MGFLDALVIFANFVIVPAISYGAQLAIGALCVTIVYSILRFSNFAQGDVMALATGVTILGTYFLQDNGISLSPLPTAFLALPFAILFIIAYVLLCDKYVYKFYRTQKAKSITLVIASMGIMFITGGIVRFLMGPWHQDFADGERFMISANEFKLITGLNEGLAIKSSQLITVIVAVLLVALVFYFLNKTKTGKSLRAYSDNKDLALLSGINPEAVERITWILVAVLTTIAGVLFGLDKGFMPNSYHQLLLPIFAAAIVGGLGSPIGAIVGGFVVSFAEILLTYAYRKFLIYLLPTNLEPDSLMQLLGTEYKFAISFLILVVVLLLRPTGIFRGKTV